MPSVCAYPLGIAYALLLGAPMFVPPEQRSIPPRWEPPDRSSTDGERNAKVATALIIIIAVGTFLAPVAGWILAAVIGRLAGH